MNVALHGPGFAVEYGWLDGAEPAVGDVIAADGTDEAMPEALYRVTARWFDLGLRGPKKMYAILEVHDGGEAQDPRAGQDAGGSG